MTKLTIIYGSPGLIKVKFRFTLNVPFLKSTRPSPMSIIANPAIKSDHWMVTILRLFWNTECTKNEHFYHQGKLRTFLADLSHQGFDVGFELTCQVRARNSTGASGEPPTSKTRFCKWSLFL